MILPGLCIPDALSDEVGVGLVMVVIAYLSLIVSELVPKQIALSAPERVAARGISEILRVAVSQAV